VETLNVREKVPAVSRCEEAFGSGWAVFAGRLNTEVWNSKLVRWLRERDELDSIPWKEILLLRVSKNQADLGWNQNQVVKPESLGRDDKNDEENPFAPLLPTKIVPVDKDKGQYTCAEVPFRISTWKESIVHLERTGNSKYATSFNPRVFFNL
jgi:hypothetical protein